MHRIYTTSHLGFCSKVALITIFSLKYIRPRCHLRLLCRSVPRVTQHEFKFHMDTRTQLHNKRGPRIQLAGLISPGCRSSSMQVSCYIAMANQLSYWQQDLTIERSYQKKISKKESKCELFSPPLLDPTKYLQTFLLKTTIIVGYGWTQVVTRLIFL